VPGARKSETLSDTELPQTEKEIDMFLPIAQAVTWMRRNWK